MREPLDLVADLNFWYKKQETGIPRKELTQVLKLIDMKDVSFFILGVRRAGKTFLAKQILEKKIEAGLKKEQTFYINFEDKRLEPYLNSKLLDQLYANYREELNPRDFFYLVLDEVHNVEGWEKWIRMMLERREKLKIIVTGSGSKILTPKLATVLTGRKLKYDLFPLSFEQFLEFKQEKRKYRKKEDNLRFLNEYLKFGGLPLVVLSGSKEQKRYFLQELYDDIITKDISFRFRLREEKLLRKVSFLVMNNFAGYVSIRKIKNALKSMLQESISPSTLSNYFECFSRSFLFIFLPIFSFNIKDQEQYPKKVYCIDTGLINAIIPKFSENLGRFYENIVAVELLRRKATESDKEIYYWKNPLQEEVDFVVKGGLKVKQLIQVCYDLNDEKVKKRELRGLLKASEELKCSDLLIISEKKDGEEKIGNRKVKYFPLWKWLLEK
ncbi:MAG: ATP-binding protein [Nanoarchaeota archaeon]